MTNSAVWNGTRVIQWVFAVIVTWGCAQSKTGIHDDRQTLVESSSVPLPPGYSVAGGTVTRDGDVLLWGHDQPALLRISYAVGRDPRVDRILARGLRHPIAVSQTGRGKLEVVDSGRHALLIVDEQAGTVVDSVPIPRTVRYAGWNSSGWVAVAVDSVGRSLRVIALGTSPRIVERPLRRRDGSDFQERLTVTSSGDRVFIASRFPPFETVVVDASGSEQMRFVLDASAVNALDSVNTKNTWMIASTTQLGTAFVTTLADARSIDRILVYTTSDGAVLRHVRLAVPLAFLGSSSNGRRAFALRRTNREEIVAYDVKQTSQPETR